YNATLDEIAVRATGNPASTGGPQRAVAATVEAPTRKVDRSAASRLGSQLRCDPQADAGKLQATARDQILHWIRRTPLQTGFACIGSSCAWICSRQGNGNKVGHPVRRTTDDKLSEHRGKIGSFAVVEYRTSSRRRHRD